MEKRDNTMVHTGESRIPVSKTRRATGESVYRPTPARTTPPNSTRPRANTAGGAALQKSTGILSPPSTPHPPPMPAFKSSGPLAVPKSTKPDYRISDLIADPNFNPFLPSTPPTFSSSMESSLNILGSDAARSSQMKGTNLSSPPSTPDLPVSTPSATMSSMDRGNGGNNREPPSSSTFYSPRSRDTSTASPESTSSATMDGGTNSFGSRNDRSHFQSSTSTVPTHGKDGSVSSLTIPRLNHDDMILPVVAKRIKAEGLLTHNVIAIGEGEDAPLYRVRDPPPDLTGGPFAASAYDRVKGMSSANLAVKQMAASGDDTRSIPSSPEPSPPTPPLPTQQGPTNRSRPAGVSTNANAAAPPELSSPHHYQSPSSISKRGDSSLEPTSPYYNQGKQQQQQSPSQRPSLEIQSPARPPRAHRPPRHTATEALADQVHQEEIALQGRYGGSGGGRDDAQQHQRQRWDQSTSHSYDKDGTRHPVHMPPGQQDQWDNYESPSRQPRQQQHQWPLQTHDAYGGRGRQDYDGRNPLSSYDQHSSSFQDPQQRNPHQQQQYYQQQMYQQQQQQPYQQSGRYPPQSSTPQLRSENYYPQQQPHPHSSVDMSSVKPEQQQEGQRLSFENAAAAPPKKKNALCCVIS